MKFFKSIHNVNIRFTDERWIHIKENHDDLSEYYDEIIDTLENPDYIIHGYNDAKIGLKSFKKEKFLAVVYKELNEKDGFLITAYFTTKIKLKKEEIIWQKR